ncbi:hypothetical protein ACLOJK_028469 [Asimina triloba]
MDFSYLEVLTIDDGEEIVIDGHRSGEEIVAGSYRSGEEIITEREDRKDLVTRMEDHRSGEDLVARRGDRDLERNMSPVVVDLERISSSKAIDLEMISSPKEKMQRREDA